MSIPEITQQLLTAKQEKNLSFAVLGKTVERDEVWLASLFYCQANGTKLSRND